MSRLNLDSVEWGEFYLRDLFNFELSKGDNQASLLLDGKIPLVSSGLNTNGITKFIENGDGKSELFSKNIITIDMFGKSFYHDYNFYAVSHGRINILIPKFKLNKYIAQFIVSEIDRSLEGIFSYNRMCSQKRLKTIKIFLPKIKKNPNWQFMEDYIKQEMKEQSRKIVRYYENKLLKLGFELVDLDVEWKEFKIIDIFDVKPVTGKTSKSYKDGDIPFISTSSVDNGLNTFVNAEENISSKNCISVDPIAGKSFYHQYKFVGRGGAGSAINLLYNKNLDEYIGMFLCRVIENTSSEKASYGVQLNGNRLKNLKIQLPVDKNGNPHWEYMRNFVKKLEKENIDKVLEYIYIYI